MLSLFMLIIPMPIYVKEIGSNSYLIEVSNEITVLDLKLK